MNTNYICKRIEKIIETHLCIYLSHLWGVIMFVRRPLIKVASSATDLACSGRLASAPCHWCERQVKGPKWLEGGWIAYKKILQTH
jgi:hypothetical protein